MFIYKRCHCSLKPPKQRISLAKLQEHSKLLKIITVPRRMQLLLLLAQKAHCVCDLMEHTGMSQTLVSHHVTDMAKAGLLVGQRNSKYVDYHLTPKGKIIIRHLINCLKKI